MSPSCNKRGLTLIELLAATVILSAMAAAAVSIQRDAGRAAQRARATEAAAEALERWLRVSGESGTHFDDNEIAEWVDTDDDGYAWRIRRVPVAIDPSRHGPTDTRLLIGMRWERIVIEQQSSAGSAHLVSFMLHRPVSEPSTGDNAP